MNANFKTSCGFKLNPPIAAVALLLSGNLATTCMAQSPEGTWDCVMSGSRSGIAYLTFSTNNNTFQGFEILVPKKKTVSTITERGSISSEGRSGADTNSTIADTDSIFGHKVVSGPWGYDIKGRVIGHFTEITAPYCVTNIIGYSTTNGVEPIITVDCYPGITNSVSFVAKVKLGKRLSMVCYSTTGKASFRGVPYKSLNLDNSEWYGFLKKNHQSFMEFFALSTNLPLSASTNLPANPNVYTVKGEGPGYSYTNNIDGGYGGFAILSSQKKIAFSMKMDDKVTDRATIGSINLRKLKSKTKGWDQTNGSSMNKIQFDVFKPY